MEERSEQVQFSGIEKRFALELAIARTMFARNSGLKLEPGRLDLGFERDVIGAYGELALAKYLGVYWAPLVGGLDTETGDVAGYQVKAITDRKNSLIVRRQDPPGRAYVLALLEFPGPLVTLVGWMMGADAKVDGFWRPEGSGKGGTIHQGAWFVPQLDLLRMKILPASL